MKQEFMGYRRADGKAGTRNLVGVLSTVICANEVALALAKAVQGTTAFVHSEGCGQMPTDITRVEEVLINLGKNPNLHSVLLVSLGCEGVDAAKVAEAIRATGKRAEILVIQEEGGAARTTAAGTLLLQGMAQDASRAQREPCPLSLLMLGTKCGASDTTSGLIANPAIGVASDLLVAAGGSTVLGEVTEFMGAEHILARHAATPEIGRRILDLVEAMEKRAKACGVDMRGGQPTPGNIKGGLTTIEEKSLGAIAKAGTAPIVEVVGYGELPSQKGLIVMDSPGREPELLTGLAASGCNLIVFSTGRGAPQGFPFVPVLKVTGSRTAVRQMADHIDFDLSAVIDGTLSLEEAGETILDELIAIASGKGTKAELSGYTNSMGIYVLGPVI